MQYAVRMLVVVLALALLGLTGCNGARDTWREVGATPDGHGFLIKTLTNEGRQRQYGLFIPKSYTPARKWPVIVFLHGIGEAGHDPSEGPLRVGLAPFVADKAKAGDFPFIVIFPQSTGGWDEDSEAARDAIATIAQVERDYSVDEDRISLTGLSTGGYGTFAIGAKYHNIFAAIAPMCPSGGDSKDAAVLAKMNIWAVENAADPFVMPGSMAGTLSAIESDGGHPKHTVYGAFGHDCWERAYAEGDLFQWLLQQHRPASARATAGGVPHASAMPARSALPEGTAPVRWAPSPADRGSAAVPPPVY